MSEFKLCPFCGGENVGVESLGSYNGKLSWKQVWCYDCSATGNKAETENSAIESWNTRPLESALEAELLEMAEAVTSCSRTEHGEHMWVCMHCGRVTANMSDLDHYKGCPVLQARAIINRLKGG